MIGIILVNGSTSVVCELGCNTKLLLIYNPCIQILFSNLTHSLINQKYSTYGKNSLQKTTPIVNTYSTIALKVNEVKSSK